MIMSSLSLRIRTRAPTCLSVDRGVPLVISEVQNQKINNSQLEYTHAYQCTIRGLAVGPNFAVKFIHYDYEQVRC